MPKTNFFKNSPYLILSFFLFLNIIIPLSSTTSVFAQSSNPPATTTEDKKAEDTKKKKKELTPKEKFDMILPTQSELFDISKKLDLNKDGILSKDEQLRLADGDLEQTLAPRVLQLLIRFSGIAFFLIFTYAGINLLLSRGNPDDLDKAKDILIQVVIGSILVVSAFGIIYGILRVFYSFL